MVSAFSKGFALSQGTLAIDLGSSSTLVGWQAAPGLPGEVLALAPLSRSTTDASIPSLVSPSGSSRWLLGQQVIEAGSEAECLRDFKALLGHSNAPETAEQAANALLQGIWERLPQAIEPQRLVLTAPVQGFSGYRRWLQQWAESLAIDEVALVDEPTAAALGAGLSPGSLVLVLDIGAGTTDLALVRLEGGEGRAMPMAQLLRFAGRSLPERQGQQQRTAKVLGKAGISVGGRMIDRWWAKALGAPEPAPQAWLNAAEALKCALSETTSAQVVLESETGPQPLQGSRRDLNNVLEAAGLEQLLDGLLNDVEAAARRAGETLDSIDAVMAVGGGSALPWVQHWLQSRLPKTELLVKQPLQAVVLGALAMTPALQVMDVLQHGISLRCWDRRLQSQRWHPLFLPGQAWPTPQPLELVLASRGDQACVEVQLGTPSGESRAEVVFVDGLPVLRSQAAGEASVRPWSQAALQIPLPAGAREGQDCLRLRFGVDAERQLWLEGFDLVGEQQLSRQILGIVE